MEENEMLRLVQRVVQREVRELFAYGMTGMEPYVDVDDNYRNRPRSRVVVGNQDLVVEITIDVTRR